MGCGKTALFGDQEERRRLLSTEASVAGSKKSGDAARGSLGGRWGVRKRAAGAGEGVSQRPRRKSEACRKSEEGLLPQVEEK